MKNVKIATAILAVLISSSIFAGPDADKIAATGVKVFQKSQMQGFDRIVFEYEGCEAWVVEPAKAAEGTPWVWSRTAPA